MTAEMKDQWFALRLTNGAFGVMKLGKAQGGWFAVPMLEGMAAIKAVASEAAGHRAIADALSAGDAPGQRAVNKEMEANTEDALDAPRKGDK